MNIWKFVFRSLLYYRRTHSGTVLGTALTTAILIGALMVGDSVRYSLQHMVDLRLGNTKFTLEMGNRYFRSDLAGRLAAILKTPVTAILQTEGIVRPEGQQKQAAGVQVVGVEKTLSELAGGPDLFDALDDFDVLVNAQLAMQLGLQKGDMILLRLRTIDYLPVDAPLARDTHLAVSARFRIKDIAGGDAFGNFNLRANQVVPSTVFISLKAINELMRLDSAANTVLIAGRQGNPITNTELSAALKTAWMIEDAGLQLRQLPAGQGIELRSERIFIEPVITETVESLPQAGIPVFTYFVKNLRSGDRTTPYSFVSGAGEPLLPDDLQDHETIINKWLATDLKISAGDSVRLTYYVVAHGRQLAESSRSFLVKAVVPLTGRYADKSLMPDFPGLADIDNCRDWQPGIPIDLEKIRPKDEKYWDEYRGIPKVFVTLQAAQSMWGNRFGRLTAIRFPDAEIHSLRAELQKAVNPPDLGMKFRDVRRQGIEASTQSVSFSELFIGLSFFVMIAALLLTGLFALASVEQRHEQTGLLSALGLPRSLISRMMIIENGFLVVTGSILGVFLAVFYNIMILEALETVWKGAVGTSALQMKLEWGSILTGMAAGLLMAFFSTYLALRRQAGKNVINLLRGIRTSRYGKSGKEKSKALIIAWITLAASAGIIIMSETGQKAAGSFFAAGTLLLISGLAFLQAAMKRLGRQSSVKYLNIDKLALRNAARHRLRNMMLAGLLAAGLFIVFTVGANRHTELKDWQLRSSGTGGFTLYAETVLPVLYELQSAKGRSRYNLQESLFDSLTYLPFRLHEGDDASCLNLNRVATPQLLGVDPELLWQRGSFSFNRITEEYEKMNPWRVLGKRRSDPVLPGIADETVIVWGLGKSVGDTLTYTDEYGQIFHIKLIAGLANSVFQGNIIISEKDFLEKYPSVNGHRLFLIDTDGAEADRVAGRLSWAMGDLGLDVTPTSKRLMAFNAVENTYLSIFLILGGFGVILGTVGIGIVVFRSTMERRNELALLRAVGFSHRTLKALMVKEHLFLLTMGVLCGALASLLASLPVWLAPGSQLPGLTILIIFLLVILSGTLWTLMATRMVLSQNLISALRLE